VTWEKNGDLVDEDRTEGHIQTRIDGNNYFLEISKCGCEDAGKYTVTAKNSLGKQTASVEVTVTGSDAASSKPAEVGSSTTTTKMNGSLPNKSNHINNNNTNNNNHSKIERKPSVKELILPANPVDRKDSVSSPTESVSSTISNHSRASSVHTQGDGDDTKPTNGRRSTCVAPTFTSRLSSTQVLEGEELLLQCEVSGDPDPEMVWLRNGEELAVNKNEAFISCRNGMARLRLRDVQTRHAGEYVCQASNDGGMVKCSSRVTVKAKPSYKRPCFITPPKDVRGYEGDTLALETEVDGQPTPEIVWSLDGEEVADAECSYVGNIAKLVLRNVTSSHSGQYMCSAINSEGEDSVACRIRVKTKKLELPPDFTAPLSDISVEENSAVCLRCMVTAIPEPSVKWMKDEKVLEAGSGVEITFQDGVAALTLEQATPQDGGIYTCLADNNEGESRTSCQVVVTALPKDDVPPKFDFKNTFDDYHRAQEGDDITLTASFTGFPLPEVTWTMNNKPIENATVTSQDNTSSTLVISPLTPSHVGHVKCTLTNGSGKASHEARISVKAKRVAPTIETPLPTVLEIGEGEQAEIHCVVRGHPQPRVSWTRDGRSLSILSTETTYEEGKATLKIRKATSRDGGKYMCTARNLSGDAETTCTVQVVSGEVVKKDLGSAPVMTSQFEDCTLYDGDDLKLVCNITGTPTPTIEWFVDDQRLEAEDGTFSFKDGVATLMLDDVMAEDSGVYKCVGKNEHGKVEASCNVTVKGKKEPEPEPEVPVPAVPLEKEPSFPILLEDMTVGEGKDIVLKCQVSGNPRPTITWLLDGQKLEDAEIKYEEDGSIEVFLAEALPEDEGVYTCIAENPLKRVMCSCKVSIDVIPKKSKKQIAAEAAAAEQAKNEKTLEKVQREEVKVTNDDVFEEVSAPAPQVTKEPLKPMILSDLQDVTVADGTKNFVLSCAVDGHPAPSATWYLGNDVIEDSEDFRYVSDGNNRKLVFAEVFPEDSGSYSCIMKNDSGEVKSACVVTVEEIDGEPPSILLKPRPLTVNAGETATLSCRVDGDPAPTLQWLFYNQPITNARAKTILASAENNHTYSLEIPQVQADDAGRYSVLCSNLLGDVTCTVSLIVNEVKKQEQPTDFRHVLKSPKTPTPSPTAKKTVTQEQIDFRSVLKPSAATPTELGKRLTSSGSEESSEDPGAIYKEVLSTNVKTRTLSEDERKLRKAEQRDFRSSLVRKVDTKLTTQEALRVRAAQQQDFRDQAIKTKVQTKVIGQDEIQKKQAEQVDFRGEAIKQKVQTKAYKEEVVKAKRAEQVDFRQVLSPTKKAELEQKPKAVEASPTISEIPRAKWKKDSSLPNTTVATRRTRQRNAPSEKITTVNGGNSPAEVITRPVFIKPLKSLQVDDGEPFELICEVNGDPRPDIKWFLEDEEIKPEADIVIEYEGTKCRLAIAESFPEDQGKYTCIASNLNGEASSSCQVTVNATEGE